MHEAAKAKSISAALLALLALPACPGEPPPPLTTAETNTGGIEEPPPDEPAEAEPELPASDDRELWFSSGPGREAILAREQRDHDRATRLLDELLAHDDLSDEARAGAELLRALEDLRVENFVGAADRLARARTASSLAPVEPMLRLLEAQARLDARDSDAALALLAELEPGEALPQRVLLVRADAQARAGEPELAIALYRRFLVEAEGRERHEARRKLAVLLREGSPEQQREAAELFEQLVLEVPLSDYATEAERELAELGEAKVFTRSKTEQRDFDRRKALAEIEARLEQREYGQAIKAADRFVDRGKSLHASEADRCQALFAKGSALFKQRKRSASQPVFDVAAKHCKKAGDTTLEVKSRYQAARGIYADGQYDEAAERFEKLALDHPDHSYADDSLIKAGESWESAAEPGKARIAYERALAKHPDGDMRDEALRRLLVQAFAEGRTQDALDGIDAAIAAGKTEGDELAKLHYFRGKALDRLNQPEQAEQAWLDAITTRPLGYPALQALSRLRERSDELHRRGLAKLEAAGQTELPATALPNNAAAERVRIWSRLGLGELAEAELDRAAIGGWPAVAALAHAGLYSEAQKRMASLGTSWRASGPTGDRRVLWELAHPAPFRSLVDQGEHEHGVPALLTFAIMQTESRFDPGATSFAGARGLIQLMPGTAETVATKAGLDVDADDLYDPATNLALGQRYLAGLTARWGNVDGAPAMAVPSYNAGPGRTDEWLQLRGNWDLDLFVESIPFDETRHYTQSVLGRWAAYRWLYGSEPSEERMPYLPLTIPGRAGSD
ncbi:transglycosylase SLT domain-containing protein [Nannocystaceae bacterium ST9]